MLPWTVWAAILGAGAAARVWGNAAKVAEAQEAILDEVSAGEGPLPCPSKVITGPSPQYRALLNAPLDRLKAIKAKLLHEMELGLRGERGGLMMLPSFVDVLPSG